MQWNPGNSRKFQDICGRKKCTVSGREPDAVPDPVSKQGEDLLFGGGLDDFLIPA
jgi:hypothetical protein